MKAISLFVASIAMASFVACKKTDEVGDAASQKRPAAPERDEQRETPQELSLDENCFTQLYVDTSRKKDNGNVEQIAFQNGACGQSQFGLHKALNKFAITDGVYLGSKSNVSSAISGGKKDVSISGGVVSVVDGSKKSRIGSIDDGVVKMDQGVEFSLAIKSGSSYEIWSFEDRDSLPSGAQEYLIIDIR